MLPEDRFPMGYISRAQGLNGAVRLNTEYAGLIPKLKGKTVYLQKGDKQFSFLLMSSREHDKESIVITLKESSSREIAESIIGFSAFLLRSDLPSGKGKQFYPYELVGMQLIDSREGDLGIILDVFPSPANAVAALEYKGVEVLIPLATPFIEEINRAEKILKLSLPEGILEVYLNTTDSDDE